MAEYIEREAVLSVIEYIRTKYLVNYNRKTKWSQFWADTIRYFEKKVKSLPAADVVEVRHGEWFLVEYEYLVCGKCGDWYYTGCESTAEAKEKLRNGDTPNYCPNCGAKMDGKGDGE